MSDEPKATPREWLGGCDILTWFQTITPPLCCRDCEQKALSHARELYKELSNDGAALLAKVERYEGAL